MLLKKLDFSYAIKNLVQLFANVFDLFYLLLLMQSLVIKRTNLNLKLSLNDKFSSLNISLKR